MNKIYFIIFFWKLIVNTNCTDDTQHRLFNFKITVSQFSSYYEKLLFQLNIFSKSWYICCNGFRIPCDIWSLNRNYGGTESSNDFLFNFIIFITIKLSSYFAKFVLAILFAVSGNSSNQKSNDSEKLHFLSF